MELANQEVYEITLNTLMASMDAIIPLMQRDDIYEVYVNPDGRVWCLSNRTGKERTDIIMPPDDVFHVIQNVAAIDGRIIDDKDPSVDAKIPANKTFSMCRFHGDLPPIVERPVFNIRKHSNVVYTLEDYVKQGSMTEAQYKILMDAIHGHKNIIAAGGTGSGKTTLLNAILNEISKTPDRIISIEDTNELQCTAEDYVAMVAAENVTMHSCVKKTLRMTPKRIVVGEVRGEEALALCTAWSTGHKGGCCTVHSNSAEETLVRLVDMTSQVANNPQPRTLANAIDIILYIRNLDNVRWIEDIIQIDDYDDATKRFKWHKLLDTVNAPTNG